MMTSNNVIISLALASVLCLPGAANAQDATKPEPHVPLQKTIGQGKTKVVPSLIVMNAKGATLEGNKLTLVGVSPNSIVFADRPVRAAGHAMTADLLQEWAPSNTDKESFTKDPPNATVSVFSKEGAGIQDAVVVLKSPVFTGERLTFDVEVLEGDLKGADGPASVFIDIIGRPLTPLSYAGVGRRMARRGAWYRGAAVGAAAGAAAAAAAAPYYHPYYPPRCGYYPYPPCY